MTEQTMPVVELDEQTLLAEARRRTQLDDFGDESFRVALRRLLQSLEEDADLSLMGRVVQFERNVGLLVNRLRTEDYFKRYPEIIDEEILAPVVIVGLPRTGTTMTHRMIASEPRIFAPLWYEVRNPAPFPGDFRNDDPRIDDARAQIDAMLASSPDLAKAHPMDPVGPDEEIMLLEHSFLSGMPESAANVCGYGEWFRQQDATPGYAYLKKMLQFLQWQKKQKGQLGERWLLKAPCHLGFIDILFSTFPDAKVVQTHRDPIETVPSLTSLVYACWQIVCDNADPKEAGRQWHVILARWTQHCLAERDKMSEDRFIDVWFKDTLIDPIAQVKRIYGFVGMQLTAEASTYMEDWKEENRRDKRAAHDYTLEQYGLSEDAIKRDFASYRERFIIDT
ncbi:MAG: sulfotransferase family protein [Pseudomonadales bacterium]